MMSVKRCPAFLFLWSAALVGCSDPVVQVPVRNDGAIQLEHKILGEWNAGTETATVAQAKDDLVIGTLQFDSEKDNFQVLTTRVNLAVIRDHKFALARFPGAEHFTLFLLDEVTEKEVRIRRADKAVFKSLVKDGKLKGKIHESTSQFDMRPAVILDVGQEDLEKLFDTEKIDKLFPQRLSITFHRKKEPEGPGLKL